jgi:hypothetical protein
VTLRLLRAHIKAHGVTGRATFAYLLVWIGIAVTARYRLSSLGLNFAPSGSSPLDTVAVLTTLLPAGVVARCLRSRVPHLEATRSRSPQPGRIAWVGTLCLLAAASPLLVTPLLQDQINKPAFLAAWSVILGAYLLAAAVMPSAAALGATLAVLIAFSTPGLIGWDQNILYNVQLRGAAAVTGALLLAVAVLSTSLTLRSDATTNQNLAY